MDRDKNARSSWALWLPVSWMLLAATASRWLAGDNGRTMAESMEGNPLQRNVFTVMLVLGLLVLVARRRQILPLLRMNLPIVLFLAYCLLSTQWSDFPDVAFKRWVKALGDFVMIMIVLTDPHRSGAVKRFIAWSSFLLVPTSILLMEFYPAMGRELTATLLHGRVRYIGVTNDKNMLGAIGLLFGLGAAWRVLQGLRAKANKYDLIAHGSILVMALWISFRANSMTSFGTFLLTMVLLVVVGIPALARKRALVNLTVATVLLMASLALFFDAGSGMVETLGRDPTLTGRTELWDELLAMNTSPLVGTGFESFWMGDRLDTIWRMHWWHPNEAHNGYIEVFLNLGWVGVFLLTLISIIGYARVIAMLEDEPDVAGLRLTYLVAALLYSGSEAGFRLLTPVWICFILGAFVVPKIKVAATAPARDRLPESPAAAERVRGVELVYPRRPRPVPAHFRGAQRGH